MMLAILYHLPACTIQSVSTIFHRDHNGEVSGVVCQLCTIIVHINNNNNNSDHISTEGGHAEHVLVTRISNKMDTSSTDKQIFECSICPSPVEFRSAIYIASASG